MTDTAKKPEVVIPIETLMAALTEETPDPCLKEWVEEAIHQAAKLMSWAIASDTEGIVQSFSVTCHMQPDAVDEGGKPVPPKMYFLPMGPSITPDDCIALAAQGIQWALGARQAQQARMRKLMDAKKGQRIWTPKSGMSNQ